MNTFGDKFAFTSFGESHGRAIGGVLDGVPPGIRIDMDMIHTELDRRAGRTGHNEGVSERARREADEVEWLSGVMDGITLGTPVAFLIRNRDARPGDYEYLKNHYRVGHADYTYQQKYGIRDWRGGGRASARETAGRVVAGCIAKQLLRMRGITVTATLVQIGAETNPDRFQELIRNVRAEGDSIGGIIRCQITGIPVGIGEPIFNKLQAELAFAVLSINACKGFDYGTGFDGICRKGSEISHISGGIAGGISDGNPVTFRCVFKPTPSTPQMGITGRHDACVAIRAVPVVEAMTALTIQNLIP